MKFSIVTVALNPGDRLRQTLDSVFIQTCQDYEIILKDGGSTDGSMDCWKRENGSTEKRVRFYEEKDTGIYDAMNQAVSHALGEYILFLNCGDVLADATVLERVADRIDRAVSEQKEEGEETGKFVFYGDTYSEKTQVTIASAPWITGFTCYRNIPCHQSCFYDARLCQEKPYDLQYRIRADYDHFLWCYYQAGARFLHMDFAVSSYEGGGFSESRENRERDRTEHRQITSVYMSRSELGRYRFVMALTLAPLRRAMAKSRAFSALYHEIKQVFYRK